MTRISDERLAEIISMCDSDAESYERQGDAPALRWAKTSREEAAALRELRAYRKEAWRPIETAPKDGTRVLCCGPKLLVAECEWRMEQTFASRVDSSGWYRTCQHPQVFPTHWMPLPAAPEPQEEPANLFLSCGDCGLDQGWADGACPRCGKMP